jgi:competence protein ComEA
VNWDVKIYLAKIKDGKGREIAVLKQEIFANNNLAKIPQTAHIVLPSGVVNCSEIKHMKWGDLVSDYLRFSKRDRIGAIVLIACIVIVFFIPHFLKGKTAIPISLGDSLLVNSLNNSDSVTLNKNGGHFRSGRDATSSSSMTSSSLFYFDPNTISPEGWRRLGLREKTVSTIINYRNKGGKFRTASDLQKIYGLRSEDFERIKSYARIENRSEEKIPTPKMDGPLDKNIVKGDPVHTPHKLEVDVNISDTTAWIALPGIGSKLSARIINFRDKLGGFYSIDQVAETFGLPDSTFKKIRPFLKISSADVIKINVNTAAADELKKHPYIRWQLANAIVAYRNEHGSFKELTDLKNIMAITSDAYEKMRQYLTVE